MKKVECENCGGLVVYDEDLKVFICDKCKALHE